MVYQRIYNFEATSLEIEALLKAHFKDWWEWTYKIEFQGFKVSKGNLHINIQIEELVDIVRILISYENKNLTSVEEQEIIKIIGDLGDYLEGIFTTGEKKPSRMEQKGICPICGRPLRSKVIYCPNCGALVQ